MVLRKDRAIQNPGLHWRGDVADQRYDCRIAELLAGVHVGNQDGLHLRTSFIANEVYGRQPALQ